MAYYLFLLILDDLFNIWRICSVVFLLWCLTACVVALFDGHGLNSHILLVANLLVSFMPFMSSLHCYLVCQQICSDEFLMLSKHIVIRCTMCFKSDIACLDMIALVALRHELHRCNAASVLVFSALCNHLRWWWMSFGWECVTVWAWRARAGTTLYNGTMSRCVVSLTEATK